MRTPASLNLASLPRYNQADPDASFSALYRRALEASDEIADHYEKAAQGFRRAAFAIRSLAFLLFFASIGIGGWALVSSLADNASITWGRTSYLFALLAGITVLADRVFLISQNRGRYTETSVKLRGRQAVFEMSWAEAAAKRQRPGPLEFTEAAADAAEFLADVQSLVVTETLAWKADGEAAVHYLSRQLEIERGALKKELDQLRQAVERAADAAQTPPQDPGAINIQIAEADHYKGGIKIKAGPYPEQTLPAGTREFSFSSLKPGLITVTLTGIKNSADRTTISRTITVKSGAITPVEL